jgi:hypothetical protein
MPSLEVIKHLTESTGVCDNAVLLQNVVLLQGYGTRRDEYGQGSANTSIFSFVTNKNSFIFSLIFSTALSFSSTESEQ